MAATRKSAGAALVTPLFSDTELAALVAYYARKRERGELIGQRRMHDGYEPSAAPSVLNGQVPVFVAAILTDQDEEKQHGQVQATLAFA